MTLTPSLRKLVLAIHVITTMGWLGSAAAYIPLPVYVGRILSRAEPCSLHSIKKYIVEHRPKYFEGFDSHRTPKWRTVDRACGNSLVGIQTKRYY